MRRRDIKVNNVGSFGSVGRASCLGLLVLGMVLVNPVASAAYAEEDTANDVVSSDEGIMTMAANASTVGISFSPTAGSTSLTPTTSVGQSAQVNVLATVNVANSGGYSVYVKSNTQNLVGQKSSANVIPGIQGSKTYANLATNTWGYYAGEGTAVPEGATYKAISVTGNGDKIAENTNSKITSDTKKIMLSFAAKIGSDKPADTYKNTVTMSVVSSPMKVADLASITAMQEMTSEICSASTVGDTKQLKDTRDGKYYWVTKLKDGNCWMTQNLEYGPQGADGYRGSDDASHAPTTANGDLNAHTVYGGYYTWDLATTTGGSAANGQATDSICPYGWKLPTSGYSQGSGSFYYLLSKYLAMNGSNVAQTAANVSAMVEAPLYFVRGGHYGWGVDKFFSVEGEGYYWSSTPDRVGSDDTVYTAYYLSFDLMNTIEPSSSYSGSSSTASNLDYGYSVRCLAR